MTLADLVAAMLSYGLGAYGLGWIVGKFWLALRKLGEQAGG